MGDVWEAYQFLTKSNSGKKKKSSLGENLAVFDSMSMEIMMKSFLVARQGLSKKLRFDEINARYEIKMELVERKKPLPKEILDASNKIAAQLGIYDRG
jgi:hypothetical protein